MNILFLDQYSDLGGAQHCLLDLLPAVHEAGWKAFVGVPGNGPLASRARSLEVLTRTIPCGSYSRERKGLGEALRFAAETPLLAAAIGNLARRFQADMLYVNGPRVLPAAAWAARIQRRPMLFHCHNHLRQPAAAWLTARAFRSCNATLVACCRYAAEPLLRRVPKAEFHLVHNGVADPPERKTRQWRREGLQIGVIGRISPEKGQAEFLLAAQRLAKILPECRFVICGDPLFDDPASMVYRRKLEHLAAGLPVRFLGWQNEVWRVMSELDLLVVPSVEEPGAPRVILEAYACGLPVVAFASGGIPEIVHDRETGFLVDSFTPEALAQRISTLVVNEPESLRAAGDSGRSLWRSRFMLAGYQQQMIRVMAGAAGVSRPRHQAASSASRTTSIANE